MPERVYCSDVSLKSGEPLLGTAGQVDVWLLLEYKPVWRAKATDDNDLAAPMKAWLERTVAAYAAVGRKARPQFIRRPELDTTETSLFVGVGGELRHFAGDYPAIAALDLTGTDLDRFERVEEPQYFVCTNGQRDLCCARYGRPIYARLRELVGHRVWQTTHVGGHRYAPNVLVLPQGALYGRVFADEAEDFVATVEAGDLSVPHLRGRSAFPPAAQVAETLVAGALALRGIEGDLVTFETCNGDASVRVRESDSAYEVIASCGKTETETVVPLVGCRV